MTPAEVIKELRWRQRVHDAALLAEQENAEARVLAEYRAGRLNRPATGSDDTADPYNPANAPFGSLAQTQETR